LRLCDIARSRKPLFLAEERSFVILPLRLVLTVRLGVRVGRIGDWTAWPERPCLGLV